MLTRLRARVRVLRQLVGFPVAPDQRFSAVWALGRTAGCLATPKFDKHALHNYHLAWRWWAPQGLGKRRQRVYQVYLVGFMACCVVLLAGLILAVAAPYLARAQYRRIRGHWPQAIWVGRLELASLEGVSLLVLAGGIGQVVTTFGNAPLLSTTGPQQWVWLVVLLYSLGGLALLAVTSLVALTIAQWHRYGLPPRTPPT